MTYVIPDRECIIIFGNRCGHNPHAPRLTLDKPASERLPLVLKMLMERVTQYFDRPMMLPSLNFANGSQKMQRSERREACVQVMLVLIKFLDIRTLCVGIPETDPVSGEIFFNNLKGETLANHAGLSFSRYKRAIADMKAAKMLTASQPRMQDEAGNYIGLPSVRAVSEHVFGCFGLIEMLKKEREKRAKHAAKKGKKEKSAVRMQYEAMTQTAKSRSGLMLKAMMRRMTPGGDGKATAALSDTEGMSAQEAVTLQFLRDNPDFIS